MQTSKQQGRGQGRQAGCDKRQRSCLSPAEVLWSAPLSGAKTHKEQLDMVESGDDYMPRQLSLKRAAQTAGSFSLSVPFKIERFLLLASSSIAGENSVTTGPCQQHRLTSEHGRVPCTDKNWNIWCLLFSSFHAILSFAVEKKLQHPKDQNICTKNTQFWLSYIRLVTTTLVHYDNVCHQMM